MNSIFDKVYKYGKSEKLRGQKENFQTEIFAHCLEFDIAFRNAFLHNIGYTGDCEELKCNTQFNIKGFGKPDVYIQIGKHTKIIIECKIASKQGKRQLFKYAESLSEDKAINKLLIYLTRDSETISTFTDIERIASFKHIRWHNIYEWLQNSKNEIAIEFSRYLKRNNMDKSIIPFTDKDVNSLTSIVKMKSFLNRISENLRTYSSAKFYFPNKLDEITDWGCYAIRQDLGEGKLWLGFYQEEDDELKLYIEYIVSKNRIRKKLTTFFASHSWELYNYDDGQISWYNSKYLSSFFLDGQFDTEDASDFLIMQAKELRELF